MSRPNLISVRSELVKDVLVGRVVDEVMKRLDRPLASPLASLVEEPAARAGYLARVVEAELFEPARQTTPGLARRLDAWSGRGNTRSEAIAGLSGDLSEEEPLERPSPDDDRALTWRIPGPGGHVRYYVAGECIARLCEGREDGRPVALRRQWLYGFFVRCCEECRRAHLAHKTSL